MKTKKDLISNLNYNIGACLIKSRRSPIFKFTLGVSESLLNKLKFKYSLTGRFKNGQRLLNDLKLISFNYYDEFSSDHHKIKEGSFMIKFSKKKKISIRNKFQSSLVEIENTSFLTIKLIRENIIFLSDEDNKFLTK